MREFTGSFTERFLAGGANSVRGYRTDSLGPKSLATADAAGGEAVLVINQELRLRGPRNVGAAVFYDTGNVFDRIKDFGFDLRHAVGFGLRYESAIGLIRVDVAFPLNRRPDDRSYQIWFGLGQAF